MGQADQLVLSFRLGNIRIFIGQNHNKIVRFLGLYEEWSVYENWLESLLV